MEEEKERVFWYDGYFCEVQEDGTSSIGREDPEIFRQYTSYKRNITPVKNFSGVVVAPERVRDEGNTEYKVTKIRRSCYDGAENMEILYIPGSISNFEWCFWNCKNLKEIHCAPENEMYCDIEGVVYSKDKQVLKIFPPGYPVEGYSVLPSTRKVEGRAFKQAQNLKTLHIPASVQEMGREVFYECPKLEDVYIEGRLKSFGGHYGGNFYPHAKFHYQGKEWTFEELAKEVNKKIEKQ